LKNARSPGAARRVRDGSAGRDFGGREPRAQILQKRALAFEQMRRAGDIDKDTAWRIGRYQWRISCTPQRQPMQCRFFFRRHRIMNVQTRHHRLRMRDRHARTQLASAAASSTAAITR
jgi:hypothetical protein